MRSTTDLMRWSIAAALAMVLMACGGRSPQVPPTNTIPSQSSAYFLGVTDVLFVSVYRNPEISVEVPVRPDGMISVPLIDDVGAEGLTPIELKKEITRRLSEYLNDPDVTIIVREMNSRFVSVIGEVESESRVPLTQNLRVLEANALAGGFTIFADKGDILIVRWQPDGSEVEYRFDYNAYKGGRAPGTNFPLQSGDTIIVPD
jgi:polysaccharide export outer membrane protein